MSAIVPFFWLHILKILGKLWQRGTVSTQGSDQNRIFPPFPTLQTTCSFHPFASIVSSLKIPIVSRITIDQFLPSIDAKCNNSSLLLRLYFAAITLFHTLLPSAPYFHAHLINNALFFHPMCPRSRPPNTLALQISSHGIHTVFSPFPHPPIGRLGIFFQLQQ